MLLLLLVAPVLSALGLIRLSLSGRQNPLDGFFNGQFSLIKQSGEVLNRVASFAGLTNEEPHPSCFGSQLVSVHLLERSFLVFFVAHGGGLYR